MFFVCFYRKHVPAGLKTILYGQPVIPAYGTDDSQSETCRPLGRGLRMIESREYPAAVERRVPGIRYAETAPVHTDRHFRTGRAVQESVFEKIPDQYGCQLFVHPEQERSFHIGNDSHSPAGINLGKHFLRSLQDGTEIHRDRLGELSVFYPREQKKSPVQAYQPLQFPVDFPFLQ